MLAIAASPLLTTLQAYAERSSASAMACPCATSSSTMRTKAVSLMPEGILG